MKCSEISLSSEHEGARATPSGDLPIAPMGAMDHHGSRLLNDLRLKVDSKRKRGTDGTQKLDDPPDT